MLINGVLHLPFQFWNSDGDPRPRDEGIVREMESDLVLRCLTSTKFWLLKRGHYVIL